MEKNIKLIWVLVNCNSLNEAESIGRVILKKRLASCFDITPRYLAAPEYIKWMKGEIK